MRETATKPPGGIPRARLKTCDDVRRFLAATINRVNRGELDHQIGGRLAYMANILVATIRDSDFEQRLAALEGQGNGR
ncbi:conserved hypothetical protein [Desulfarculus baarsii DSM 2075]|uniref:Uncharacterized protein n=1 Tax=Desulfarculus baarsii (strain ATCC 33931 / DSM 2075 / LMG 7858 / VKM B-1802 / 2st14) TaxID=644282 RepID=E1QDH2_DESB2|nr:hypothetical protein [Desulfarculus baarsii]ADK83491.1 conserved hypothetical protein [Desulfarculus baarsii DSM 2075]